MKLNRKYIWNILLIVCITAVAMYFALKDNFSAIMDAIARMNPLMLILVMAWGMLYNAIWGISYVIMGRRYIKNYSLLEGIEVAFVGTFFAGITPSSTGGQFGQIYILRKQGIKVSDGASLLWADFIIYQTAMMIYVTILFALRFAHYANLSAWFWMVFLGYIVNLVVIVGLYTIALFPNVYIRLSGRLAKVMSHFKFIKNPEKIVANWTSQVENFTVEIKKLAEAKKMILQCLLINFVRLTLYYMLPFVVARAIGIDLHLSQLIDVMALSSFVTMANSFIPLPGASGGTEVVFSLMFSGMLGSLTGAVLLLWRVSSYYLPLIAGAVIFLVLKNHYDRMSAAASTDSPAPQQPERMEASGTRPALPDANRTQVGLDAQIQKKMSESAAARQPAQSQAPSSGQKDSSSDPSA